MRNAADEIIEAIKKEISREALASYIKQANRQKSELEDRIENHEKEQTRLRPLLQIFPALEEARRASGADRHRLSAKGDTTLYQATKTFEKLDRALPPAEYETRRKEIEDRISILEGHVSREKLAAAYQEQLIRQFEELEKNYSLAQPSE